MVDWAYKTISINQSMTGAKHAPENGYSTFIAIIACLFIKVSDYSFDNLHLYRIQTNK